VLLVHFFSSICVIVPVRRTAIFSALLVLPLMTRRTVDDKGVEPMDDFADEEIPSSICFFHNMLRRTWRPCMIPKPSISQLRGVFYLACRTCPACLDQLAVLHSSARWKVASVSLPSQITAENTVASAACFSKTLEKRN
jgi:hypothetical protein